MRFYTHLQVLFHFFLSFILYTKSKFLLTVSSSSFTLQLTFLWPLPLALSTASICFQVHLPHNHQGILAWLLCLCRLDFLILHIYSICTRFNEVLVPIMTFHSFIPLNKSSFFLFLWKTPTYLSFKPHLKDPLHTTWLLPPEAFFF